MARIVKLKFKKTLGSKKVFDYCPLSTQIAVSHIDSDLTEPGDAVLLLETKGKKQMFERTVPYHLINY